MPYPLVFVHIPKTAGTTFEAILDERYGTEKAYRIDDLDPEPSLDAFKDLSPQERNAFTLIKGHLALELHPYLSSRSTYITFLRDPVDHFISMFNHQKNTPQNQFYKEVQKMDRLDDILTFGKEKGIDNLQTRHLGGGLHHLKKETPFIDMEKEGERILEKALSRLHGVIDLVLLTEEFDMSLLVLEKALNWSHPPYYKKMNISKKDLRRKDLDSQSIQEIRTYSSFDVEVHKEAVKLFSNKKEELLGANAEKEFRAFQKENSKKGWTNKVKRVFKR